MNRAVAGLALVLGLATSCGGGSLDAETLARDEFAHSLAVREGRLDLWYLSSRGTLVFADGFSATQVRVPGTPPRWVELSRGAVPNRDGAGRWIGPAAHLRVRTPGGAMRLKIWGYVDVARIYTHPRVTVSLDGRELGAQVVGDDGRFTIEAVIEAAQLDGWSEVYLRLSSVHEPWRDPAGLQAARVEGVEWEPVR